MMEMLVTKFSKGKYKNEGELFNEPISSNNVKLMGEMIALQALRTAKKYDWRVADKYYLGLIKDLHHMGEIDYIVSDGYDIAQTAICFLCQFMGRKVSDLYGKDSKGIGLSIKLDPVNCFEHEQTDYSKADAILAAMHLNEMELAVLNCVLKGMVRSEIIAELGIGRGSICYRKNRIRYKYETYIGSN